MYISKLYQFHGKHPELACPGSTPRSATNCGIYPPLGSLETTRLLIYTYFTVFTARTDHLLLTGATGA